MDCIFCKILNGDIPGKFIYEDDILACFMDINPICDGHVLIVPKKHIEDVRSVDKDTLYHMFEVANKISEKLMKETSEKGYSLSINYGDKQEVKHLHLHLMPNYKNKPTMSVEEMYNKLKNI